MFWLCSMYVDEIARRGVDDAKAKDYMGRVRALQRSENPNLGTGYHPARLASGIIHAVLGQGQQARESLSAFIKVGVKLLSGTDDSNDEVGYSALRDGFLFLGERYRDDCLAAYSVLALSKLLDGNRVDSHLPAPSTSSNEQYSPCTACHKDLTGQVDCHVCTVGLIGVFCNECAGKTTGQTLGFRRCSSKHYLLHVPAGNRSSGLGWVTYRGEQIPLRQWLDHITDEWNVTIPAR